MNHPKESEHYEIIIDDPVLTKHGFRKFSLPLNGNGTKMVVHNNKDKRKMMYPDFYKSDLDKTVQSLRDKIVSDGILINHDTADSLVRYFRNECVLLSEDEDSPFFKFKNGNGNGNGNGTASGNGKENESEANNKAAQTAISVSDALRLHCGFVKVQGMISSLYPPHKMVSATKMYCSNCRHSNTITYEKPEPVPRALSKKCPSCEQNTISISHEYVNAVNVELQDTDSFSEIERLPVILFDEYTRNIHAGERVTISGKIHIIQAGKKGKSFSFLYADSAKYEYKENIIITEQDKNAIERFVQKYGSGVVDKLVSMFANSIIGYEHVKEGLLMCAASSGREVSSHKRTRLNALLVGDPGLAKSALLREAVKLVSNSRYESGQNSSGRSLTAIVSKEDESYVLRLGPVPLAKEAICAINELGRMNFEDQAYLLDTMEEGEFTINKYGINARIRSPTVIIASANPVKSSWDDNGGDKIDLDQIPAIKPLVDRFDLLFVFRTSRDKDVIRVYADKKSDLDDKLIPDYYPFLKKHIIRARQFNPRLSDEAKSMLSEYWANLAENFGSPRILEALFRLAKARSRLKLKQIVDAEDAIETMQFYNVMLLQHLQAVKIPTNPRDVTYNECINILKEV